MINSIEQYLSLLKKNLAGCDRATIQDAISDAEGHLRTALTNAKADPDVPDSEILTRIIEKYGTPEEIACAYRDMEPQLTPTLARPVYEQKHEKQKTGDKRPFLYRLFGVFIDPAAWGAFLYLIISLITGILYFTWAVTGISVSAGLLVLIIGIPIAGLFLLSFRGISLVEGRIVEALLGIRMPRKKIYYPGNSGLWGRFKYIISDKYTWFTIIYFILQLPLGIIHFSVLITLVAVSLSLIAAPILYTVFDIPAITFDHFVYYPSTWNFLIAVVTGVLILTLTLHLSKFVGSKHGAMAKALLVRR